MFSCVGSGTIQLSTTTGNAGRSIYACDSHNLRIVRNVPVFKLSRAVVVDVQAIGHGDFAFMAKSIRTYLGERVSRANHSAFGRARRFGRIPPEDILLRMELQDWECFYCADKITLFTCELDHVVPLAGGGEHFLYNIVLACRTCNNTKRARSLKRFCEIMRLNLNETRQRWAELNALQHALTNFDDEYGARTAQDADSLGNS